MSSGRSIAAAHLRDVHAASCENPGECGSWLRFVGTGFPSATTAPGDGAQPYGPIIVPPGLFGMAVPFVVLTLNGWRV